MAVLLVDKGQAVYSADGAYVGRVLQCDASLVVVGESRWALDHYLLSRDDVAASNARIAILRMPRADVRPESSEPWIPPRDAEGRAAGVDQEPLRAGMAEVEDPRVGTEASPPAASAPRPAWPRGAPAEAEAARPGADVGRRIEEELLDYELGGACAPPGAATAGPAPGSR